MTVRERAFHQMLAYLEGDRPGAEPQPPEGLHPLSLAEWNKGIAEARDEHVKENDEWQDFEDAIVVCVKIGMVFAVYGAVYWIHTPWALMAGSGLVAFLMWRWL